MNLQTRVRKLEDATGASLAWDLTQLTDAELIGLERCFARSVNEGVSVGQLLTPELLAALEKVKR